MKATPFAQELIKCRALDAQYENQNHISHGSRENPSSSWYYSMRNCITQKKFKAAIFIYIRNRSSGINVIGAIPLVLKACASIPNPIFGKVLHSQVVKSGVERDVMVGTSLIDMYGKCQHIVSARKVFDRMPERNVVSWNAMIGAYLRNRDTNTASDLFEAMTVKTSVTWNEMIGGHARNGDLVKAKQVFDSVPECLKNVVTWTVMVDAYACVGDMDAARDVFDKMPERNFYAWSVMITGYFKKGDVEKAREVFDGMSVRNLVNWNSLISGYAQNGLCKEAYNAFKRMQEEGFDPDEVTLASVLSVCAQSGMLEVGQEIHESIIKNRIEMNEFVVNGLVDMYAKCGDIVSARLMFEGALVKNDATWNSLITGFAIHGKSREAIEFFTKMEESGWAQPNDVTFLSVLSACAHGGLVEEGLEVFGKMEKYGLKPNVKHYGCFVDLLGRAGKLQEAFDLVKEMPMVPNETVLGALFGACRIHCDSIMAKNVLELINELNCDAHYLILSSIYAVAERWEMAEGARNAFLVTGSEKTPGYSVLMS